MFSFFLFFFLFVFLFDSFLGFCLLVWLVGFFLFFFFCFAFFPALTRIIWGLNLFRRSVSVGGLKKTFKNTSTLKKKNQHKIKRKRTRENYF